MRFAGGSLKIPFFDVPVGERVRVRIRSRDVAIALTRPDKISVQNIFPATVEEIVETPESLVDVRLNIGCPLLSRITPAAKEAPSAASVPNPGAAVADATGAAVVGGTVVAVVIGTVAGEEVDTGRVAVVGGVVTAVVAGVVTRVVTSIVVAVVSVGDVMSGFLLWTSTVTFSETDVPSTS